MFPPYYYLLAPAFTLLARAFVGGDFDEERVRKASKVMKKWVGLVEPIDLNKPGTFVESIKIAMKNLDMDEYLLKSPEEWIEEHDVQKNDFLASMIYDFYHNMERHPVPDIDNDHSSTFFRLGYDGEMMDLYLDKDGDTPNLYNKLDTDYEVFRKFFWEKYQVVLCSFGDKWGDSITIDKASRFAKDNIKYIGPLEQRMEEIKDYYNKGKKHSVLLDGEPGNGKTTFCAYMAKKLDAKLVVIPGTLLQNARDSSLRRVDEIFDPDCVLVDDFERIDDVDATLNRLSLLSNNINLTFYTTNDKNKLNDAIIRPGRIDQVYDANVTDEEDYIRIQNYFLDIYDMEKPDDEIREKLIDLHDKYTGAYVREAVERAKSLDEGWGHPSVFDFEQHTLET